MPWIHRSVLAVGLLLIVPTLLVACGSNNNGVSMSMGSCGTVTNKGGTCPTNARLYRQLSPDLSTRDCVDLPRPRHALEFVLTAVLEIDTRTGDEVLDRRGHEHLPSTSERRHPRPTVDSHAGNIVVLELDLSAVEPGPHVDA